MKHFLYSLIALCFLISGAVAEPNIQLAAGGFGAGNNLTGFWQKKTPAAGGPSISYVAGTEDAGSATIYTYTAHATGTAGATRDTIVTTCSGDSANNLSVSSLTVGGAAATELLDTATATGGTGSTAVCATYIIDNPTGTTATIVVTLSEPVTDNRIDVYAAYDLNSNTPTDTSNIFDTDGGAISGNTDIQADGIAVGVCAIDEDGSGTSSWTAGLTQRSNSDGDMQVTTGDTTQVSAQTPLTITCTVTAGTDDSMLQVVALR